MPEAEHATAQALGATISPLLLGHRGAPRQARENTVAAFRAALSAGLDGFETDVQRTADGVLVLHHDAVLPGGAFIASRAWNELHDMEPHVPLLDDLLPVMREFASARLNLEVKTAAPFDDARALDLCRALAAWPSDVRDRTWVSSFDPLLLLSLEECLAAEGIHVPQALLLSARYAERLLAAVSVTAVHPHHSLVSPVSVAAWHAAGLAVHTWTVNEPSLATRLIDAGVDGLIGDAPEVLLAARTGAQTATRAGVKAADRKRT